jgi:hypothetical protein
LRYANLENADMRVARLRGAKLQRADLREAGFGLAYFTGANPHPGGSARCLNRGFELHRGPLHRDEPPGGPTRRMPIWPGPS